MSTPHTPATNFLNTHGVLFTPHLYPYVEKGGTSVSSKELGVDEHIVVKTLVMQTKEDQPLIVLMHGDCQVDTKALAGFVGTKKVFPCKPELAQSVTGYQVGGTSPFGTLQTLPVYVEETILGLERIYINGGQRGFLVSLSPQVLVKHLGAKLVKAAIRKN